MRSRNHRAIRESEEFLRGISKDSPWTVSLRAEYHKEGLDRWNNRKVYEVCRMFRCTLKELCAWAGLFETKAIASHESNNRWPMYLTLQWDKLVRFKLKLEGINVQDALASKGLYWGEHWGDPKNEEEAAA